MANHVLVKEPTGWHCLCCGANFPLDYITTNHECIVNTKYEAAREVVKELPAITDLASWDKANQIVRDDLETLISLDEDLSDGLQATKSRFRLRDLLG